jgi:hypothetical protein
MKLFLCSKVPFGVNCGTLITRDGANFVVRSKNSIYYNLLRKMRVRHGR